MAGPPSRSRDVSQPSLGADHELIGVVGEIDADSPPMRTQMVSIHSRSPGVSSQAMETHWEEQAPDYYIKHPRFPLNSDFFYGFRFFFLFLLFCLSFVTFATLL